MRGCGAHIIVLDVEEKILKDTNKGGLKMKKMLYELLKNEPKNIDTLYDFLLDNYGADFIDIFIGLCKDLDDMTTGIDGFLSGIKDDTIKNMLLVIVLDILIHNHLIEGVNDL